MGDRQLQLSSGIDETVTCSAVDRTRHGNGAWILPCVGNISGNYFTLEMVTRHNTWGPLVMRGVSLVGVSQSEVGITVTVTVRARVRVRETFFRFFIKRKALQLQ